MSRPGSRWLALARRWCTDLTRTRVVEPLVADMQMEHHAAVSDGRKWRARLVVAMAAASLVYSITGGADSVPALLGAWLPNLTFFAAAVAWFVLTAFRRRLSP